MSANVDVGVPATTLLDTPVGPTGFIGLTHPQLAAFTRTRRSWTMT